MQHMHKGEFIRDRLLPSWLQSICAQLDVSYTAYSEDWIIKLQKGIQIRWIYGYQFDVNNVAAAQLAGDKAAAYTIMATKAVPAVQHILVRSGAHEPMSRTAIAGQLQSLGLPVVIKPLFGSSGKGVHHCTSAEDVYKIVGKTSNTGWVAAPFVSIMAEYRVIIFGKETLLVYEKTNPYVSDSMKFYNLGMGALAHDIDASHQLYQGITEIAARATGALNLELAAVDVVQLDDGTFQILELNSGLMFEHYARQSEANHQKSRDIYETIVTKMFLKPSLNR